MGNFTLAENSTEIKKWFEKNKRHLSKFGLAYEGGEPNTLSPYIFNTAKLKVLIVRLSEYFEVSKSVTHGLLYSIASNIEDVYVDLAYLPNSSDEEIFIKNNIPLLFGNTSKEPAKNFDVIAISNSVVQELVNLPALLHFSGIALSSEERIKQKLPFILLGGANSYANVILFGKTSFNTETSNDFSLIDGLIVGDGEESFKTFLHIYKENKHLERKELLKILRTKVSGFLDPSSYEFIYENNKLVRINPINGAPFPIKAAKVYDQYSNLNFSRIPIFYSEEVAGSYQLLISNGCPYFCSFCKESWEQKPYREREVKIILRQALELKKHLGIHELGLMSFNINTFSELPILISKLEELFSRVEIKSQRLDGIAYYPKLIEKQIEAGKRSYTCAIEGISNRIRNILQKGLSNEIIIKAFIEIFKHNIRQMKIFIIVTGLEDEDDITEFDTLVSSIKTLHHTCKTKPQLTFSISALFRPPHTPLQYLVFDSDEHHYTKLQQNISKVQNIVKKHHFDSRISATIEDVIVSEWLAYADTRSTPYLIKASIDNKIRYRGSTNTSFANYVINLPNYIPKSPNFYATNYINNTSNNLSFQYIFPFDIVHTGVSKDFIIANYQKILEGKAVTTCYTKPFGVGKCLGCAACDTKEHVKKITEKEYKLTTTDKIDNLYNTIDFLKNENKKILKSIRTKTIILRIFAFIPKKWIYCGNRFLNAAIVSNFIKEFSIDCSYYIKPKQNLARNLGYGIYWVDFEFFNNDDMLVCVEISKTQNTTSNLRICINDNYKEKELEILKVLDVTNIKETKYKNIKYKWALLPSHFSNNESNNFIYIIDSKLKEQKIKHIKQWNKDILEWNINSGHVKSLGIEKIKYDRINNIFYLETLELQDKNMMFFMNEIGDLMIYEIEFKS